MARKGWVNKGERQREGSRQGRGGEVLWGSPMSCRTVKGDMSGSEEAMGENVADDGGGRERASRQREFGEALSTHKHTHTAHTLIPSGA